MTMTKQKMLLIHGWNYANYTSSRCRDAWLNRSKLVEKLSQHFNVVKVNLPGFCGEPDPLGPWTLNDYVDYVNTIIIKEQPKFILGYSFGGAIVLRWKKITGDTKVKTFLVSPAIIRRYKKVNLGFIQKVLKNTLPSRLVDLLRDLYLVGAVKNSYYSKATKVMRETYRNIVAVDLRDDLTELSDSLTIIYGENDTTTPPSLIREVLDRSKTDHKLMIIPLGGHDIANSHTEKLVSLIVN